MKPTEEQEICVTKAETGKMLKIEAGAGTGKTSTLVVVSNAIPKRSLYLAFNKVTAEEANERFGAHVSSMTTHSLAYRSFGIKLQHKLSRPKGSGYVNVAGTGSEIARYYGIKDVYGFARDRIATAAAMGLWVKQTVENFQQSADETIGMHHVPKKDTKQLKEEAPSALSVIHQWAVQLWKDRIDPNSIVLATHDTYLKLYQLSKPRLNYEILYVDEFQDTTPCVLDIVMRQEPHAQIIIVGDRRQAIYGWRGAINAMEMVHCDSAPLSQSFRYGQRIADVASAVLEHDMRLTGLPVECKVGFNVVDRSKPYMYLFRTNTMLLIEAVDALQKGEKVKIEVDIRDFVKMLESADALYRCDMKNVKHEEILPYPHWLALVEEAEGQGGGPLKRMVSLVESGMSGQFIDVLENYKTPSDYKATYTTAHKAKGRESEQVILAGDFPSHYGKDGWKGLEEAEQNLLYVAVTRAKCVLEINRSVWEVMDKYSMKYEGSPDTACNAAEVSDERADMANWTNENAEEAMMRESMQREIRYSKKLHWENVHGE